MTKQEKQYTVFFTLKANNLETVHAQTVCARTKKDALQAVKKSFYERTGRNAFAPRTDAPDIKWYEEHSDSRFRIDGSVYDAIGLEA